uniref:Uncharacterized protein n=1 Tax=Rhizophora mucronata TaxID=61149 RepID=A0A2P2PTW4_RHIMU
MTSRVNIPCKEKGIQLAGLKVSFYNYCR